MTNTLVIDTSYGSAVGIVGHTPLVETDSRTHVERLQVNIAQATKDAQLQANEIDRIVVSVGPAPFTGLRAGLVAAKALAFATGAELLPVDSLAPQALLMTSGVFDELYASGKIESQALIRVPEKADNAPFFDHEDYVLSLNDARRRQVYMALYDANGNVLIPMDIDYPGNVVARVSEFIASHDATARIHVIGHGANKYKENWLQLPQVAVVSDLAAVDIEDGLSLLASCALSDATKARAQGREIHVDPLYLRRPDVSVPNPLKHVLGSGQASLANQQ